MHVVLVHLEHVVEYRPPAFQRRLGVVVLVVIGLRVVVGHADGVGVVAVVGHADGVGVVVVASIIVETRWLVTSRR